MYIMGRKWVWIIGEYYMELKRLSERLYYLPAEERTDRPILGYIRGDTYSLAVDAGNSSDHVEKIYRELRESDLRLPDFTVITHFHYPL